MIKVGLTGGIGSGKTTIAHFFGLLNIPIYYSDLEAKQLMISDKDLIKNIKNLLGEEAYLGNGYLNKTYVSNSVFKNKERLEQLNAIVHPAVKLHFKDFCKQHFTSPYIIKESAILIETGLYKDLDKLILVTAEEKNRAERVSVRDSINQSAVQDRIEKQWSDDKKKSFSDFIIQNDNKSLLIPQLLDIHNQLINS